jgi:hypothetical protein
MGTQATEANSAICFNGWLTSQPPASPKAVHKPFRVPMAMRIPEG